MNKEGGQAVNKDDYETGKIQGVLGYLYDRVSSDVATEPDTIDGTTLTMISISKQQCMQPMKKAKCILQRCDVRQK